MSIVSRTLLIAAAATVSSFAGCKMQQTAGLRDSGQSRLMDDTFAGANKCNPENHKRPFIVEWDATDMSNFESLAASDIVFVKYEGCSLTVLDECKNDSIRGEQGAYKPVEWTTGQLETIDIHNEGELYAKLPLGSASLGGRVSGGESFHMEYFVAGTRNASRDAVYSADLEGRYGCEDATHFVYGYNLGAFALGSANELNIEAGGSAYGVAAGGSKSSGRKAEKRGGKLEVCDSDSATEVSGCKAPIRLSLREIRPGESPEAQAMAAPEDPESASAAAVINAKMEMSDEARARLEAATTKMNSGDGKGCLKELNVHDQLNPKQKSTDPKSPFAQTRAQCVMLSGKCDAGKSQLRKAYENSSMAQWGPEQIDKTVSAMASMHCRGKMNDRDALLQVLMDGQKAAYMTKKDVAFCDDMDKRGRKLIKKVKPKDDDDTQIVNAAQTHWMQTSLCYQRAGDCDKAYSSFVENYPPSQSERLPDDKEQRKTIITSVFNSMVKKCEGKAP